MFRKLSTYVLFLLLSAPVVALAQGTGTLAGRVIDQSGAGLPGASVIIDGTQLGAATDLDGNYRIIGVPVGTYDVTAQFVGYVSVTTENVEINSGYTRQLDLTLREDTEQLGEIVVEFERPIIQRDAVGATRVVSGEDLRNLPVRGVANVASLQGGVVTDGGGDLFIRGGREQEVAYYVDGVKVTASAPVAVNQAAVQEQEMLIGTIPARYGDVQGGVISITTRTGRDRFFGSAELITSEVLDSYGYNLAALSLGGPIVPNRIGFFLSGQYNYEADANPYGVETYQLTDEALSALEMNPQVLRVTDIDGEERFLPFPYDLISGPGITVDSLQTILLGQGAIDSTDVLSATLVNAPETFTADRFELERGKNDPLRNLTFNGNLNFDILPTLSLRVGGGYDTRTRDEYTFGNSLYNRNAFYIDERDSYRMYGTLRQRINDNAFYQVQGEFQDWQYVQYPNGFGDNVEDALRYGDIDDEANRYSQLARRYYVYRGGQFEPLYVTNGDGSTRPGTVSSTFSLPGATLTRFQQAHNQQVRFSASATTQLGLNQLEFGGEYEQRTQRFYDIAGASLARYYADGSVEGSAQGLPEGGVTSYDQLPFEAVLPAIVTRYGYNYLGTEEVDDQDIDGFYPDEETGVRGNTNVAPYKPLYYAGYIQDKIEFRDLVINLGLRVDAFDNNTQVLRDIYAPVPIVRVEDIEGAPTGVESDWAVYFNDGGNVVGYRDLDGNFYDTEGIRVREQDITETASGQVIETDEARSAAFTDYETQVTVMPRVGVSFPVTDRALFFASYNVTSQRPTEQAFAPFTSYEELQTQDSRVPNAALEPEKTTQYELGFRQRLGERAAVTLSGFYRTQENKISNRRLDGGFPSYGTYRNVDFTTTQGVELGFDLRRTNNLAVTANYTLSFAKGTGSDAGATANIVWRGDFFPDFISPADFDQRHTANVTVDYRFGDDEGPMVGGVRLLENFGVNVLGQFGSGTRYTPLAATGFSVLESFTAPARGTINSGTLPATSRIDLRVDRSFNLMGSANLKAYLWVQNLLNTRNVLAVYRATGVPDQDGYLFTEGGRSFLNNSPDPAGAAFNYNAFTGGPVNIGGNQSSGAPSFYGLPRRVRLGLLFDF